MIRITCEQYNNLISPKGTPNSKYSSILDALTTVLALRIFITLIMRFIHHYNFMKFLLESARWILVCIGIGTVIAAIVYKFESPKENCRNGSTMTFPLDRSCIVEFNSGGRNYGWTLIPYSQNEHNSK